MFEYHLNEELMPVADNGEEKAVLKQMPTPSAAGIQ